MQPVALLHHFFMIVPIVDFVSAECRGCRPSFAFGRRQEIYRLSNDLVPLFPSPPPSFFFFFFLLVFSFYIFFCIKNVHLALKNLVGLKKNFFSFDFPVGLWWTHSDRSVAEKDIQWLLCGIVSTVEDIRSAGYTLTSSPFSPSLRPVQVSFYGGSCAVKKYSTRDCFTHTHTYTHRKRVKFDWFDWFVHILEKEEKKTFVSLSYVHLLVMLTDTAFLDDAQ